MIRGQAVVDGVQRVGDGTRDGSLLQVADEIKDVGPQFLDVGVLGFGDVVDEDVDLAPVFGEIGSDLLTDESPRQMRDLEGALDFVVVRDGDERHAPPPRDVVEMKRLGKALGAADFLEEPLGRPRGMSASVREGPLASMSSHLWSELWRWADLTNILLDMD